MRQIEQTAALHGAERKRVEAVVETLAAIGSRGECLAEIAHDARNMVTALGLYCDLLEEPGVLATQFLHYGGELRLVAAASRRLVEKLVSLDTRKAPESGIFAAGRREPESLLIDAANGGRPERDRIERSMHWDRNWELLPAVPIVNLGEELRANRNLLSALAGPSIAVIVDTEECALPVRLTAEDLTRVMVNLVKNAAEAMRAGGWIHLGLSERAATPGDGPNAGSTVLLTVEDNGPGFPANDLDHIFDSGYTTRGGDPSGSGSWPAAHRGLGLSITRSIIEAAGGRIHAANRSPSGACLQIELPVVSR